MTTATAIFDPTLHEPLVDAAWDEHAALDAVRSIVDEAVAAQRPDGSWPWHPDDLDDEPVPTASNTLYLGAAGVVLALDWLQRELGTPTVPDVAGTLARAMGHELVDPLMEAGYPSWMIGTSGIAAVDALLGDGEWDAALAELEACVETGSHDPFNGAGCAMAGALAIDRRTGDARFEDLLRDGVHTELAALEAAPGDLPCELWRVDLYGREAWVVGAAHGAAGTFHPMLAGAHLLDDHDAARALAACRSFLACSAEHDGEGRANWRTGLDDGWHARPVQWCHGAPGILTACWRAGVGDDATSELLVAGAELAWHAGPLVKGPSICHGTAGSALGLLAAFELTQDELHLTRARRLAMHALAQVERRRTQVGHGRHSLLTGDLGVATAVVQCARARAGIVGIDTA